MAGREGYAYCIGTGRPAAGEKKRKEKKTQKGISIARPQPSVDKGEP